MKKYLYITLATLVGVASASLTSCGGDNPEGPDDTEVTEITLEVDKTTIEADGVSPAVFTVKDQTGRDITSLKGMRFINVNDNSFLDSNKAIAYMNGEESYRARYNGKMSINTVTITGQNRAQYEKYYRHVAVYQVTGTWCVNCPGMTSALQQVETDMPGRMIRMTFHEGSSSGADPFEIKETLTLRGNFGIQGFPSGVVDMRELLSGYSSSVIKDGIKVSLAQYPATCGVKVSSTFEPGTRTITVNPEVAFEKAGEYTVGYAVVTDNLQAPQAGANDSYRHNHTVRAISALSGGLIGGSQTAGTKWTPTTPFTIILGNSDPIEDVRVIVFVLKKEVVDGKDKYYINNLATCAANGGTVDYKLNE